jgi:hypothetical protein
LQIFTFIVATPLVAIAAYQAGNATRPTTLTSLRGVFQFLQLGSLFETDPLILSMVAVDAVASVLALLVTALLVSSAALRKKVGEPTDHQSIGDIGGYEWQNVTVMAAVGALTALSCFVFAYIAKALLPGRSVRAVIAASVLPLALLFIDVLLCNYWGRFKALRTILAKKAPWPRSLRSLNFLLAVLPIGIVAVTSLFNPIFIQRATLVFAPFLLIVIASGLANLMRRNHRWFAIALILAFIHGLSVLHFKVKPSNIDYKGLAEQLAPQIEDSDLIFVHGRGHPMDWVVAPIFYYLNAGRYHFVGRDFAKEIENHSPSRVWILSFPSAPTEKGAVVALASYELRKRVDARNIFAQLYVGKPPGRVLSGEQPAVSARISE